MKENKKEKEFFFKKTGRWGYVQLSAEIDDVQGSTVTYTGTITDITERVNVESVLVRNEKMVTMGELSAGIAHELNNPLSGILQSLQNINRRLQPDLEINRKSADKYGLDLDALEKYVKDRKIDFMLSSIKAAGERASDIVQNMLDFSRTNSHSIVKININDILDKALQIADSDYDLGESYDFRDILIEKEYSEVPAIIDCYPAELEQVFFNIIKNAAQELKTRSCDDRIIKLRSKIAKDSLILEILNNGPVPSKTQQHLMFEPFFTTKDPDKGTGLGLSVAKYIVVKKHKGDISTFTEKDLFGIRMVLPIFL